MVSLLLKRDGERTGNVQTLVANFEIRNKAEGLNVIIPDAGVWYDAIKII